MDSKVGLFAHGVGGSAVPRLTHPPTDPPPTHLSKLVAMQYAGQWRVKKATLRPYHAKLCKLGKEMRKMRAPFRCTHVRREFNKRADALANEALDTGLAFARPSAELIERMRGR